MEHYDGDEHINVGTGEDLSIRELAEMIRDIVAPGVDITIRRVEAGRHAAQAARREPPARPRRGATASRSRPASPPPTSGSASARCWAPPLRSLPPPADDSSPGPGGHHGVVTSPTDSSPESLSAEGYRARRVAHWNDVARTSARRGPSAAPTTAALERGLSVPAAAGAARPRARLRRGRSARVAEPERRRRRRFLRRR